MIMILPREPQILPFSRPKIPVKTPPTPPSIPSQSTPLISADSSTAPDFPHLFFCAFYTTVGEE